MQNLFTVTGLSRRIPRYAERDEDPARKFAAKNPSRNSARERCARHCHATKIAAENFYPRNAARRFSRTKTSRHENGRACEEDAAETSTTRRSEIRAP